MAASRARARRKKYHPISPTKIRKIFLQLDIDHDGQLSAAEVQVPGWWRGFGCFWFIVDLDARSMGSEVVWERKAGLSCT